MKNKGFTLPEMLAVVSILLIIATIITPKVLKETKNSEEKAYQIQIDELVKISKIYMNNNINLLPEDQYVITLEELKNAKLITSEKVINPKTNEELTGCILVKYENNKYSYTYTENDCD